MSRRADEKKARRLAGEKRTFTARGGRTYSVALVYPNSYFVGMSNLGFQFVYRLLAQRDDVHVERAFLPDKDESGERIATLESGRPLSDFDMIAFSVPFENDFLHILKILELARIPLKSAERGDRDPLVIMGGVTAQLNPEPVAAFIDLVMAGEGEVLIPAFFDGLALAGQAERAELLAGLAMRPGFYVPSLYDVSYKKDGTVASIAPLKGVPERVKRVWLPQAEINGTPAGSALLTRETEFGDLYLLEVGRGCGRGCRFCAAGFVNLPPRERSADALRPEIEGGIAAGKRIGLISPSLADYGDLLPLCAAIHSRGGKSSFSSVRADALGEAALSQIRAGDQKTVTIAPEAGTERLRNVINKGLKDEDILGAVERIADAAVPNVRLYFMIGLPTEEETDIDGLIDVTIRCRDRFVAASRVHGRVGRVTASVNCFVPKPFTPFQWHPMEEIASLDAKLKRIRTAFAPEANVEMIHDAPASAHIQGVLSRGDRRLANLLLEANDKGGWKRAFKKTEIDLSFYTTRARGEAEVFPWETIDAGVDRGYLRKEYERGLAGKTTPPCNLGACTRCGIC